MATKYRRIRVTPAFHDAYSEIRESLRRYSPAAYRKLPAAMTAILDVIEEHPRAWPVKRRMINGANLEYYLAIKNIGYRRIHVRYLVNKRDVCYLLAAWVDGQDEPRYIID